MKRILSAAVLLAVCAAFASAHIGLERRPTLGILPFTGGAAGEGETIATLISEEITRLGTFSVLPRTAILEEVFAEHYFQLSGLTDSDTIQGIGHMLRADYVLSGQIRRLGGRNLVIATVINVETFKQVAGYWRTYRNIGEVRGFLPSMAGNIVEAMGRDTSELPSLAITPFQIAGDAPRRTIRPPGTGLAAQLAWLRNSAQSGHDYLIEITGNETLTPQTLPTGRSDLTITLRGSDAMRIVRLYGNGTIFTVGSGVTLVLDRNITLSGATDNDRAVVEVNTGGALVMNTGARITGNANDSTEFETEGGGVRVNAGGMFTLNGGEIFGNSSARNGGGVFVYFGGTLIMNYGEISRNSARGAGGGAVILDGGTFVMNYGEISGNTADGGGGGVGNAGTFYMHGGINSGNTTSWLGGGVLNFGVFRASGGIIHGGGVAVGLRNTAVVGGAALHNYGEGAVSERGDFDAVAGVFNPTHNLGNTNSTITLPRQGHAGIAHDAETLAQILAIEILNAGGHVILPRTSVMQAALEEHDFQMAGYVADEEMVRIGGAIGAEYVLAAQIHGLEDMNMFTTQIVNVRYGNQVGSASRDYQVIDDGVYLMAEIAIFLTDPENAASRIAALHRQRRRAELFDDPTRFWSVGASIGTSFSEPWIIGTLHGTIAPFRNAFFRVGVDAGLISGTEGVGYHMIYPFAHLAFFMPFEAMRLPFALPFEGGGLHAGAGMGFMIAEYQFDDFSIPTRVLAMDFTAGLNMANMIEVSYTLRTSFSSVSHKLSIGYTHRFRARR